MRTRVYLSIILSLICLLFLFSLSCSQNSTGKIEVQNYLEATESFIGKFADMAIKVSSLYENSAGLQPTEIANQSILYAKEYNKLLGQFILLESPSECLKLRGYIIDALTYAEKELIEYAAAHSTGDIEHLYESQKYYTEAQKAIALASGEWGKLENEYR